MEKVLRRTALIKSQAKRKARIQSELKTTRDRVQFRIQTGAILKETHAAFRQAREARRQDWEMGPIAPWREAGKGAATNNAAYGTFSVRKLNPPAVPEAYRVKDWFVREGDRVVVVAGLEGVKGKIGLVKSVDKATEHVVVEGVNLVGLPNAPRRYPLHGC